MQRKLSTQLSVYIGVFAPFLPYTLYKMKAKVTKKFVKSLDPYAIGYCDAWYLLRFFDPIYYTAGIYGRSEDVYNIDGVYFSTGYAPTGKRLDRNKLKAYNKKAESLTYKDKNKAKKWLLKLAGN